MIMQPSLLRLLSIVSQTVIVNTRKHSIGMRSQYKTSRQVHHFLHPIRYIRLREPKPHTLLGLLQHTEDTMKQTGTHQWRLYTLPLSTRHATTQLHLERQSANASLTISSHSLRINNHPRMPFPRTQASLHPYCHNAVSVIAVTTGTLQPLRLGM